MHRRLALLVLLASTWACWVGTPAAGARPLRPGPWAGEYLVTLTHTHQRSSWSYDHTASGPCDAGGRGSGFEDSRLTGGSARLTATGATPPGEYGVPASSLQVEFGIAPDIPGSGTVDRDGTLTFDQPSGACGSGDGGGHPPARDCGIKGPKNTYELRPDGLRHLSWRGTQLGSGSQLFQNCPFMARYEFPRVMPVDVPFHPAQFGPGMPVVDLAGRTVEPFAYADTTATTTGDVQLRIIP